MDDARSARIHLAIRVLWMLGFAVGTTTHVIDVALGGIDVYEGAPTAVRAFWVALTALDPTVIVLMLGGAPTREGLAALRWRRAAVVLGAGIMIADVAVNATMTFAIGMPGAAPGQIGFGLVTQTAFAVFVLATAPVLWRRRASTSTSTSASGPARISAESAASAAEPADPPPSS
ncbi:hypothetical protein GCM10027515_07390 [Schumannella luteola]|uniref:Uncharacterized protein n=1 Tax=Schumannella luteola TaxID=472059 RepID=A0A852YAA2_9MICO|nr:hypothetical protein [Schumannella luteola]NYG98131.1 hypothetical protein [Schumannella luteola]TPX01851.1 hypothetical protein FJ656_26050 [Schumannella luteola]